MDAITRRRITGVTPDAVYLRAPRGCLERLYDITAWRDVDSRRRRYGITLWATGCEVHVGRRLYRVRWWSS